MYAVAKAWLMYKKCITRQVSSPECRKIKFRLYTLVYINIQFYSNFKVTHSQNITMNIIHCCFDRLNPEYHQVVDMHWYYLDQSKLVVDPQQWHCDLVALFPVTLTGR